MERSSLDDMLAGIPSQLLDQKITSDIHLADLAKLLVGWKEARSYLGLTEAEEETIWRDHPSQPEQRLAFLRMWRSKYYPTATYRNLAKCFYNAGNDKMVTAIREILQPLVNPLSTPPSNPPSNTQAQPLYKGQATTSAHAPRMSTDDASILDLPDVVTASKPYLLSPNVVNTPDPSSYWELQQHCNYYGEGTIIAIVDSGIQKFHPAFASREPSKSLYQYLGNASLTFGDSCGHGTLCAGVACGDPFVSTFDGSTVRCRGVAPKATLVVSKAYERSRSPWYGVEALWNLVIKNPKPDVVVLSSGGADQITELHEAIKALDQRGVIVVCAASNEGAIDKAAIHYPARYPETICIGSNDRNGNRSSFSPVGEDMDFLALGEHIIGPNLVDSLTQAYGTSFAAPAVGGLICLILQAVAATCHPDIQKKIHNNNTMKKLLRKLTSEGPLNEQEGYGSIKRDQVKNFFSNLPHFIERLIMEKSI